MNEETIRKFGDELYAAWLERKTVAPLTERDPRITLETAYRIALRTIDRRVQAGETIVGKKIGVTSKPVQDFLGVFQPDFGQLTSGMVHEDGATIDLGTLIQAKAEAELAFVLKEDLAGPGITAMDVIRATDYVAPCFEIVDSRITDWKIRIQDTVADNASCGVFVLGDRMVDPRELDMSTCGMVLEKNGEIVVTGAGAATLAHPLNAVAWLVNMLGTLGIGLKAGEIVLSGALGAMVPVEAGDNLRVTIGGIGGCSVRFA